MNFEVKDIRKIIKDIENEVPFKQLKKHMMKVVKKVPGLSIEKFLNILTDVICSDDELSNEQVDKLNSYLVRFASWDNGLQPMTDQEIQKVAVVIEALRLLVKDKAAFEEIEKGIVELSKLSHKSLVSSTNGASHLIFSDLLRKRFDGEISQEQFNDVGNHYKQFLKYMANKYGDGKATYINVVIK